MIAIKILLRDAPCGRTSGYCRYWLCSCRYALIPKMLLRDARAMKDKRLSALIKIFQELKGIDPEFPLQYALCLGAIGYQPGLSLTRLAVETDIPLSTVSRIISSLSSPHGRCGGLVRVTFSSAEMRKKELHLTAQGEILLYRLIRVLEPNARTSGRRKTSAVTDIDIRTNSR